jgi:hypothetical protein
MPAGQGKDAERFAAAVEQGLPPSFADDDDLARELEIVAMLRSHGAAFAPDPDAKARAKQRLVAMLAAEQSDRHGSGSRPPVPPQSAEEQTAPLGRILEPAFPVQEEANASAVTGKMAAYAGRPDEATDAATEVATTAVEAPTTTAATRPGRHGARHSTPNRPAGRSRASRRPAASGLRRRAVLVGTAAMVMLLAIASGGIFASRNALPGDNLYALKRVAESAGLALTFDNAAKARRHLDVASTRLDEVEKMVGQNPQAPVGPQLVASAIQEFDAATGEGSRILLATDDTGGDPAAIGDLRTWASTQVERLSSLRPELPVPAAADADGAIDLLDRLVGRTEALTARSSCSEISSGADDLGPLPAKGACAPRPADPESTKAGSTSDEEQRSRQRSSDSTSPDGSEDPSSSAVSSTPGPGEPPALLPDIDLDGSPLDGRSQEEGSDEDDTSSATRPRTPNNNQNDDDAPPSFLPQITLPPLLPGLPGITIG